jgi:hypothetical protein
MRTAAVRARIIVWVVVFISAAGLCSADTQIYLFGKMGMGRPIGTSTDYEAGVDDFPMSESYTTKGFGLGFRSGEVIYLGLEGRYNLSGKMTLLDPSDNDSVDIDTYSSITGLLILGANVVRTGRINLFVEAGGGMSFAMNAETQVYTSEKGFETQIEPPEKTTPFVFFGGAGVVFNLSPGAGIFMNGRYQVINAEQNQTALVIGAGVIFGF